VRKIYPDSSSDLQKAIKEGFSKQKISEQDQDIFHILHNWRDQYGKIMDECPETIIKSRVLLKLVCDRHDLNSHEDIKTRVRSLTLSSWAPIVYR